VVRALQGGSCTRTRDYFTLPRREEVFLIRTKREARSHKLLPRAIRYGRVLGTLPYMRMIALAGSITISNVEAGKDIDCMIVTASNYLWVCCALALLVTRVAYFGGISLCLNYLTTEHALTLIDQVAVCSK
jgi:hypothetical protein